MGTNNRQRRREKAKRRAEQARHRPMRATRVGFDRDADRRLRQALWVTIGVSPGPPRAAALEIESAPVADLAAVAEEEFRWAIGHLWANGWQPSELARHGRRVDPPIGRLLAAAIAADLAGRDRATIHPRWLSQATAIATVIDASDGWLARFVEVEAKAPAFARMLIVRALRLAANAGALPVLIPPPGSDPATWDRDDGDAALDDPVLTKVRALLAQAESTNFDAEAEAFTAKAQELMARHSIDAALLWAGADRADRPVSVRLPVDDPYADEKHALLRVVALSSRCQTVRFTETGLTAVFGFRSDVAAAEVLFTSLLVQSQTAMRAEAANAPPGSHVRGASFRRAFLYGYARRIDARLAEVNVAVEHDVAAGGDSVSTLLPVLAARRDAIDAAIAEQLGATTVSANRRPYYDRLGWERGGLAADRAELATAVGARSAPAPAHDPGSSGRLL